jgi:hypothetical protein
MSEHVAQAKRTHLIIGLGGTGGRVIRALRKRIWALHKSHDVPGIGLAYVYADTSDEMMGDTDPSWRVLGSSVQLPRASRLLIGGASVRSVLGNPGAYPSIAPWIGSKAEWEQVASNVVNAGRGGQRRRLGRFLFAMKARDFHGAVRDQLRLLRDKWQTPNVHVHIVAGLAGGTGGGSIVDVLSMLAADREMLGGDARISVFAILPEPNAKWNDGNYYANGYAALRELNSILAGGAAAYQPHDLLREDGSRIKVPLERVGSVYLCTNSNGVRVKDVGRELPVMVSDFLFERISESQQQATPVFTLENMNMDSEVIPNTREAVRARRFAAFGITRVEYPEAEIEEYLTLSLMRSALLALVFNNWSDAFGFLDIAAAISHAARPDDAALRERWLLTDGHLRGVLPVLEQEKAVSTNWKLDFRDEWQADADYYVGEATALDRGEAVSFFNEKMEDVYQRSFRNLGVRAFFAGRQRDRAAIALRIRQAIETDLLAKWRERQPGWSLGDVAETLAALRQWLESRRGGIAARVADGKKLLDETRAALDEQREAISRIGPILWSFRKSRELEKLAAATVDHMALATEIEADDALAELLPVLAREVATLETHVADLRVLLDQTLKAALGNLESRLRVSDGTRLEAQRHFNPDRVRALAQQMTRDKPEMDRLVLALQGTLLDTPLIKERSTFRAVLEELGGEALDMRLERECEREVMRIHDRFAAAEVDRVLGVKLLQRLRMDLSGDPERMQKFVRDLVDEARPFVEYDQAQINMAADRVGAPREAVQGASVIVVQRPHAPELDEFGGRLDAMFQETGRNISIPADSTARPNALTVMSVDALLPARYIRVVQMLRQQYQDRLKGSPVARLEVHGEDICADLPDLFPEQGAPAQAAPYLLIARALGLVFEDKDDDGRRAVVLRFEDEMGLPSRRQLARRLDELPEMLAPESFLFLRQQVDAQLAGPHRRQDARRALRDAMVALVRQVVETAGERSPAYTQARDVLQAAIKMLEIEA